MISFVVGIQYIELGKMTVGGLTAFIGYISTTLSNFVAGTQQLLERMPYWRQSLDRFNYFLNLDEYKKDGKSLEKIDTIDTEEEKQKYLKAIEIGLEALN